MNNTSNKNTMPGMTAAKKATTRKVSMNLNYNKRTSGRTRKLSGKALNAAAQAERWASRAAELKEKRIATAKLLKVKKAAKTVEKAEKNLEKQHANFISWRNAKYANTIPKMELQETIRNRGASINSIINNLNKMKI